MRTLAVLVLLAFLASDGLLAQRRTSGSGGSDTRGTPSRGSSSGGSSSGGDSRRSGGSSSGGSRSGNDGGSASSRGSSSGSSGTASTTSSSDSRRGSKIGAIRREADRAVKENGRRIFVSRGIYVGACFECDYWGWYGPRWGWYHGGWWYPSRRPYHGTADDSERPGQGYDEYPYADADSSGQAGFVRTNVVQRRGFGAVTAQYFSDAGSQAAAGRFGLEGARGLLRGELDYSFYNEPGATSTDRLHTFRLAIGVQPRLGNAGYLVAAVGLRGLAINGSPSIAAQNAGGVEGELGIQLLPRKPFGLNVTGRVAAMQWQGSTEHFALQELNSTGSIFMNRLELQAGWHWMKIGPSPAFGGPVAGLRIWF